MIKIKSVLINSILVVLGILSLLRFLSQWHEIQKVPCCDIRNHLHPARRLMEGFDPNWYVTPAFEASEFKEGMMPRDLLQDIARDGCDIPKASNDMQALNALLKTYDLIRKFPECDLQQVPVLDRREWTGADLMAFNRMILQKRYPKHCPRLENKTDLTLNPQPTLITYIQSASPSFLIMFYPLFQMPYDLVKLLWFFATWFFMLLSVFLLASCARWRDGPKLVWIAALFFIATSYAYQMHIIIGAKYVLYLFMMSLACFLFEKKRFEILGGLVLGCLMTFRPNAGFMMIFLLIMKRWKFVTGILLGVLIAIVLVAWLAGPSAWRSYFVQGKVITDRHASVDIDLKTYKFGNSFFDGAALDVQKSFVLQQTRPNHISTSWVDSTSPFGEFLALSQLFLDKRTLLFYFLCVLLCLILSRLGTIKILLNLGSWSALPWERTMFILGMGMLIATNYMWAHNSLHVDVLWILPISLMIAYGGSWQFFWKKAALPIIIFLFFSAVGIQWFLIYGIGIVFGEIIMLMFLPFVMCDILARDLNPTRDVAKNGP